MGVSYRGGKPVSRRTPRRSIPKGGISYRGGKPITRVSPIAGVSVSKYRAVVPFMQAGYVTAGMPGMTAKSIAMFTKAATMPSQLTHSERAFVRQHMPSMKPEYRKKFVAFERKLTQAEVKEKLKKEKKKISVSGIPRLPPGVATGLLYAATPATLKAMWTPKIPTIVKAGERVGIETIKAGRWIRGEPPGAQKAMIAMMPSYEVGVAKYEEKVGVHEAKWAPYTKGEYFTGTEAEYKEYLGEHEEVVRRSAGLERQYKTFEQLGVQAEREEKGRYWGLEAPYKRKEKKAGEWVAERTPSIRELKTSLQPYGEPIRKITGIEVREGYPVTKGGREMHEFTAGMYEGFREEPLKMAVTTAVFAALPPVLKGAKYVGKAARLAPAAKYVRPVAITLEKGIPKVKRLEAVKVGVEKGILPPSARFIPKGVEYGMGAAYAGAVGYEMYVTPPSERAYKLGRMTTTEFAPMATGLYVGRMPTIMKGVEITKAGKVTYTGLGLRIGGKPRPVVGMWKETFKTPDIIGTRKAVVLGKKYPAARYIKTIREIEMAVPEFGKRAKGFGEEVHREVRLGREGLRLERMRWKAFVSKDYLISKRVGITPEAPLPKDQVYLPFEKPVKWKRVGPTEVAERVEALMKVKPSKVTKPWGIRIEKPMITAITEVAPKRAYRIEKGYDAIQIGEKPTITKVIKPKWKQEVWDKGIEKIIRPIREKIPTYERERLTYKPPRGLLSEGLILDIKGAKIRRAERPLSEIEQLYKRSITMEVSPRKVSVIRRDVGVTRRDVKISERKERYPEWRETEIKEAREVGKVRRATIVAERQPKIFEEFKVGEPMPLREVAVRPKKKRVLITKERVIPEIKITVGKKVSIPKKIREPEAIISKLKREQEIIGIHLIGREKKRIKIVEHEKIRLKPFREMEAIYVEEPKRERAFLPIPKYKHKPLLWEEPAPVPEPKEYLKPRPKPKKIPKPVPIPEPVSEPVPEFRPEPRVPPPTKRPPPPTKRPPPPPKMPPLPPPIIGFGWELPKPKPRKKLRAKKVSYAWRVKNPIPELQEMFAHEMHKRRF